MIAHLAEVPPVVQRDDESTKIDRTVLQNAREYCALRKLKLAEYLSGILAPLVERDLENELQRRIKRLDASRRRQKGQPNE